MGWMKELAGAEARRRGLLDEIDDPWELLAELHPRHGLPLAVRMRNYGQVIRLIAEEPGAGVRDALLAEARRVFEATIRGMRADLRALAEVQKLRRMLPK